MKTKFTQSAFALVLVFGMMSSYSAFAQADGKTDFHSITVVVPAVALLDLEATGSKNFTATFLAPTEAGNKLAIPDPNNNLWLNYSSVQTLLVTKRVDVALSEAIPGVDIKLVAANAVNTIGAKGTPVAAGVLLSASNQILVNTIGSTYTLTGTGNGHLLTYSFDTPLDNDKYGELRSGTKTVNVLYTLADN